jgi:hypothetical protein
MKSKHEYTPGGMLEEATEVKHEEFAERAGRRLESVADRLEDDTRSLGRGSVARAIGEGIASTNH